MLKPWEFVEPSPWQQPYIFSFYQFTCCNLVGETIN